MQMNCKTCFHNIKPDELPLDYLEEPLCELRVIGFPNKVDCPLYSDDGLVHEVEKNGPTR